MLRACVEKDTALIQEILAEGHRNPRVAEIIREVHVQYRAIFREMATVANPDLSDMELAGAEELLLACLFSAGHRELTGPSLNIAETVSILSRLIVRALRS